MKYSLLFLFFISLLNCKDIQKSRIEPLDNASSIEETQAEKRHLGIIIMEKECYFCHDPKAPMQDRIAPPMEAIKRHYIDSSITKEEFTEALIRWVDDPETEKKMPGAHKSFGPMPYMPKPVDAITLIAEYIYDYELERPDWFETHFQNAHKKGVGMGDCRCLTLEEPEMD
jgi:hypothetical protein